ncbi:MAG: ABC transporter ATP-binding protein [Proteobacteria bacterium]|nr:ABC transporter ATP-binding protein [Pseudomonadota bacterium]
MARKESNRLSLASGNTGHITRSDTPSSVLVRRLWRDYIRAHKNKILFALICMVLAALSTAVNAWMMQPVLDKIFLERDMSMLVWLPLAVLGTSLVKGLATYGQSLYMKFVGQRIVTDMQISLFKHLLDADVALFSGNASGKLISRFSNDVTVIRKNVVNFLNTFAKESVTLVALVGVMFYQSVTLSLVAFTVLPLAIYPTVRLGKRMRKVAEKTQEELGHFTASLDDTFQGIRTVKSYNAEGYETRRAKGVMEKLFSLYIKAARIDSAAPPIMEILTGLSISGVIWYGGLQVVHGTTTPGAFFSFIAALIMAYKPLKSLSGLNANVQEGLTAISRLYSVLDTRPEIQNVKGAKALKVKKGSLVFDKVHFSYNAERKTLENVTLRVPAGKRVALVGASGSGKSTIMNLALRFYDPDAGRITIDDQDIKHVTLDSLRDATAIVAQESMLFDDTIRANICYGTDNATEEAMIAAAKSAAAHDFIKALPEGYDTMVGQHGVRLSGGQRQRIAIARAMLKNAPILLLDEATSALDTASEHHVQEALDHLMKDRTTLVIAHRLSTVMDSDIIYVMHEGRVIEHGKHKELLARRGEYARLYRRQFAAKEKRGNTRDTKKAS